ncbi:hypothetical protein [Paenibacillus sp. FSL L8-0506]|uniref:hypothetical protein n=1 Tax=Paenibacillus sp. FSL L8-0506 TaxID=2975335 RepID=UPI0030FA8FBC
MLFTNGRLQSFEQMMKQPPHHHDRRTKKQPHAQSITSASAMEVKATVQDGNREKTDSHMDSLE